ncbi:hypothetical protein FVA77_00230 [Phyllobacterium endophyticum]|nr:hypothetical protein FVA77_00230 [Phyllobacterium endophyticum]
MKTTIERGVRRVAAALKIHARNPEAGLQVHFLDASVGCVTQGDERAFGPPLKTLVFSPLALAARSVF